MKHFFSRLNYSFGNEDWRVEQKALKINPENRVLCITASGDRPLHLLLDDCEQVTSVDANPVQNYLLSLKTTALHALSYEEYLKFLGALPCKQRERTFRKVLQHLDPESARYWIANNHKIRKGVIYQGDVERLTKLIALIATVFRGHKIKKLFSINDLEEQKDYVDKEWDTYAMRKTFEIALSKVLMNTLAIDPGLYSNVDPSIQMGPYIYNRMLSSLKYGLAKENMLLSLIFRGYVGEDAFPPYLKQEGFSTIKSRLDKIQTKTENMVEFLGNLEPNSYDRFSMSDIASYMDTASFNLMVKNIYQAAKPGSRFCIRQFSSNHVLPPEFEKYFLRETNLEKSLERDDNCFVYRFMVGTIDKPS